jgi:hypothetical protein
MLKVKMFDNDKQVNDWLETYCFDVEIQDIKFAICDERNAILVVYKLLPLPFEPSKEELMMNGQERSSFTY